MTWLRAAAAVGLAWLQSSQKASSVSPSWQGQALEETGLAVWACVFTSLPSTQLEDSFRPGLWTAVAPCWQNSDAFACISFFFSKVKSDMLQEIQEQIAQCLKEECFLLFPCPVLLLYLFKPSFCKACTLMSPYGWHLEAGFNSRATVAKRICRYLQLWLCFASLTAGLQASSCFYLDDSGASKVH